MGRFATEIDVAGRRVHLLARREMLNLAASTSLRIEVMDLGSAMRVHATRILGADHATFAPGCRPVADAVNRAFAGHGLRTISSADLD